MDGIIQRGYEIRLHDDATPDLLEIESTSPEIAYRLYVFLEEYLQDDPDQRLNLAVEDYRNEVMQVGKWSQMFQRGFHIWRIKLQGRLFALERPSEIEGREPPLLHHRIPYAFDEDNEVIWILGIFERKGEEEDYDPDSKFGRRIQAAYLGLGLRVFH